MLSARSRATSVAILAIVLGVSGCNSSTGDFALGKLSAHVVDANNAGVSVVKADLYKVLEGGSILWRATVTSSDGVAVFGASDGGVVAGNYYIHLTFTTPYDLAAGETNDRAVTVRGGDDLVVTFHVVAKLPGGHV
ncbi:MAG: hypothetical protein ACR2NS_10795 [Gemmatimonadaceae bacterium]